MKPNTAATVATLNATAARLGIPGAPKDPTRADLTALRRAIVARMWTDGATIPTMSVAIGRSHPQGAATILSDCVKLGMCERKGTRG
jgi:hypothetical protein